MITPYYIVYEERLRRNLEKLAAVQRENGISIIMAFKANALWKTFPVIREYFHASTASSLNEMRLSREFLKGEVHAYCPVYTDETFPEFLKGCSHITFNSLSQFDRFSPQMKGSGVSAGLRVNPRCSVVQTDIYNPCLPGSRFGVDSETLARQLAECPDGWPEGLEGFHFHALCESGPEELGKILEAMEHDFGPWLGRLKWLNMGGGHLITREDYDTIRLKEILSRFKERHPGLHLIMEPGSAFTWQTGDLEVSVLDVVENAGIRTAIIDASFACHMPDCLEMPYKPAILQALPENAPADEGFEYRLGGNSCLSGDYTGTWRFARPLKAGDRLTLLDMNHYTTVKTNMFNGIEHPSIFYQPVEGDPVCLREFTYDDYRSRMD